MCLACATPSATLWVQNVKVSYTGADDDATAAACADFALTPAEAGAFFTRAKAITGAELHQYNYAPCYVRGSGTVNDRPVSWEIRAAGTATVRTDETTTLLADPTQRPEP